MRSRVKAHGPRWQRLRRATLERDGWRCRACGGAGKLEVDHIQPIYKGGEIYSLDNLQTLCKNCHLSKTLRESGRRPRLRSERWRALVNEMLDTSTH